MSEKTIGFNTFEQFHGRKDIGSSRIRAKWLCNYWPEAEEFVMGRRYEVVIFQKSYWLEYAGIFKGIKILDICDADFLHWSSRVKQMIDLCDGVTTSTPALAEYLSKITDKPVICIPDRLDFECFKEPKKIHSGPAETVAWFGYSENFAMLDAAVPALPKYGIKKLIVVANGMHPYRLPANFEGKIELYNYPWSIQTVNKDLLRADIVLNPQLKSGKWKYKSNNKTISAWALGLPVAHNEAELRDLIDEQARVKEADKRYNEVRQNYDVKKSVEEMKQFIYLLNVKKMLKGE